MSGVRWLDVSKTLRRSNAGGSAYCGPRFDETNWPAAKSTRSSRSARSTHMRCSSVHLLSHSPGSGVASGAGDENHVFHSRWACSNAEQMPRKPGT